MGKMYKIIKQMAPEYIHMVTKDFKNFHSKALSIRGLLV
jgi:hypothetical protein